MEKKTALFIDDDQDFLEAIQNAINHPYFQIKTLLATNGYHAIDGVIKQKPDVLFIDFNLPRASGAQILPILKSIKELQNIPVYFVTGHDREYVLPLLEGLVYEAILEKGDTLSKQIEGALDRAKQILRGGSRRL